MDDNFVLAPRLFTQLYVIRVPLASSYVTCVYALMSGKTQADYDSFLTAVVNECRRLGYSPDPTVVVTDFETAVIRAVSDVIGRHVQHQGCFFHLTQSTWRKVQQLGLTADYQSRDDVRHWVGMLDGMAFLPLDKVEDGLCHVRDSMPDVAGLDDLLTYFDTTYVRGTFRRVRCTSNPLRMRLQRTSPLYPPPVWNVFDATCSGSERTNNCSEGWNQGMASLVGHQHPSVFHLVTVLQQDAAVAETVMIQDARGQAPAKRQRRAVQLHQRRLQQLCFDVRDGSKSVPEALNAFGHCVRLL